MSNKIAIIDLDSVAFTIFNPNKIYDENGIPKRTEDNSKYIYIEKTEDEIIKCADETMNNILLKGQFTHYIGFIKGKDTIKDKLVINPNYKQNRSKESPIWWNYTKEYLINKWDAVEVNNYETDDACNMTKLALPDSYICAIDSDLLRLEGTGYNWRKDEWITIGKDEAYRRFWSQMITGNHNNIPGLKGKGIAYVNKLFNSSKQLTDDLEFVLTGITLHYNEPYYIKVLQAYYEYYKEFDIALEEYYKTYKCLKILDSHPDFDISKIKINLVERNVEF